MNDLRTKFSRAYKVEDRVAPPLTSSFAPEPLRTQLPVGAGPTLGMLFATYCSCLIDRQIFNIIAEPIRKDLDLQDWQIGLLGGLAFSLFYAVLGLGFGRWADRSTTDRPVLIAQCLALWSAMTMICALPVNFVQFALARFGVGVGEAGCSPAAHSLIADIVPLEHRAFAMGLYSLATPTAKLVGLGLGGVIAQLYGWRAAFLIVGAPGLLLAIICRLWLPEPRRWRSEPAFDRVSVSLWTAIVQLARIRSYRLITLGAALMTFLSLGEATFLAAFAIRTYHLSVAEAGLSLGLILGRGGAVGGWLGGWLSDRLGRRDLRAYGVLPAITGLGGGGTLILAMLASRLELALAYLAVSSALNSVWYGPAFSTLQGLAPPKMRATASAFSLLVCNLIGMGLGPVCIGLMSDQYSRGFSIGNWVVPGLGIAHGLQASLIVAAFVVIPAAACFLAAARQLPAELRAAGSWRPG